MNKSIYEFLSKNNLLSQSQSGFAPEDFCTLGVLLRSHSKGGGEFTKKVTKNDIGGGATQKMMSLLYITLIQ